MTTAIPKFTVPDYIVMTVMLSLSSCIGIYFAWKDRRDQSNKAFLMGNRQLGVFPVSMSLMASFQSATTVLGYPAEMFYKGTQFWVAIFGLAISNVLAAEIFLPVLYNLQLTSVNSYLERRYNSFLVRVLGSLSFITNTLLYMGVVLYGPAVALESVTGVPGWMSILSLGLVCTFYTVLGGMKAVVWTDALQMTIMVMGLASVVILGVAKVGSFSDVWTRAEEGGRIQFFNTQIDPHSSVVLWNVLLGTTFVWFASYGTSQTQVQRFCSVPTLKKARIALYVNIPGVMLNISLGCLAGLVIYANYYNCDPLKSGKIKKGDQLIPYFVMETLSVVPGLPGLFVACVFSGALSTLSSGYNSLAAVTWEDFLMRWSNFSDRQAAFVTRSVAAFYGVLSIGLAFLAGRVGSILKAAFAMSGALSGPLLAIFTLGVLVPPCNGKGALAGLLLGQTVCLWIVIGALLHESPPEVLPTSIEGCKENSTYLMLSAESKPKAAGGMLQIYRLSHLLVPVLGFTIAFVSAMIVSLLTGKNTGQVQDPSLFSSCVRRFLNQGTSTEKQDAVTGESGQLEKVNLHTNPVFSDAEAPPEDQKEANHAPPHPDDAGPTSL